jgi:hypothetical protein
MANVVLVIGKSGTGKSRSIINLDPASTAIINVIGKDLPFKGWKSKYNSKAKNIAVVGNFSDIPAMIAKINSRPEITVGVIDDFQYLMCGEVINRAKEKQYYEKYKDILGYVWNIVQQCRGCRDDMAWFVLSHSEEDAEGTTKCKTLGKAIDNMVTIEGMFSIVLNASSRRVDSSNEYFFETQSNGSTAKSPEGMFADFEIPNDLKLIYDSIKSYEKGGA